MKENTLLKIALIITVIGILLLFTKVEIQENSFREQTFKGTVLSISKTNTTTFITSSINLNLVIFDSVVPLEKGDKIEIRGEISKGSLLVDELRVI